MINEEVHIKQKRIKYIRVLEKFLTRTMSLLRLDNFDEELFKIRCIKNFKDLNRAESIDLNSHYYSKLKQFIDKVMYYAYLEKEELDAFDLECLDEEKSTQSLLLKEANILQKEKNATSYKKDKHKHSKFDDGY